MPAPDLPSLDTLIAAAGLEPARGLQITTPSQLPLTQPTVAALVLCVLDGGWNAGSWRKYADEVPVVLLTRGSDGALDRRDATVATLRAETAPPGLSAVVLPALEPSEVRYDPEGVRGVIGRLRDPEDGCPWDLEQDHRSLRPHLLEETYEVLHALDVGDAELLQEELGDLFMQIVLHAQIAEDGGEFDLGDVSEGIRSKLVRRHPHVFAEVEAETADEVAANWEKIKATERPADASALDGVPVALPALQRAQSLAGRAQRQGFFWPRDDDLLANLADELREIAAAATDDERQGEFGDLLFALADFARRQGIQLEDAVRETNAKFERRFRAVEARLRDEGRSLADVPREEQMRLWEATKQDESVDEGGSDRGSTQPGSRA